MSDPDNAYSFYSVRHDKKSFPLILVKNFSSYYIYHRKINFCGIIIKNFFQEEFFKMTKNEIIEKVKELIAAPSCCADVKAAAEIYLAHPNKDTADELIKILKEEVCTIDETIALAESDEGKKFFGAEQAANMVKLGNELKAKGEKYCFCPACQAGVKIYENKEVLC